MKVYSPADMAAILQIKPATLRKYSALLEQYGYKIERNSQGHRYYQDKDIITLRNVMSGIGGDVSLEKSVQNVVQLKLGSTVTNDINSGDIANDSDIDEIKEMLKQQNDFMRQQSELIGQLFERLDRQQEYINDHIARQKEREANRDENVTTAINESLETRKQIAASAEDEEKKKENKRGFFHRLFRKGLSND